MRFIKTIPAAAAASLFPTMAMAHTGLHGDGWLAGLGHPVSGIDHLLAMVAVGFWAGRIGGTARWLVPLVFVGVMALGAVPGALAGTLPGLEGWLAASVVFLGLMVAFEVRLATLPAALLVGCFAAFHGLAHGAEMPAMTSAAGYAAGFLATTAVLHGLGIAMAAIPLRSIFVRFAGLAITATGLVLAAG